MNDAIRWVASKARVEVLLRQQALKPKSDVAGKLLTGQAAKSSLVS